MNTAEFLVSMIKTWSTQLDDRFPLPAEQRCALVREQMAATIKMAQPSVDAPAAGKPGPKAKAITVANGNGSANP